MVARSSGSDGDRTGLGCSEVGLTPVLLSDLGVSVVLAIRESEDEGRPTKYKEKRMNGQIEALKAELTGMLSRPLIAKGVSTRYITSGSRPIADDILAGKGESCSDDGKRKEKKERQLGG